MSRTRCPACFGTGFGARTAPCWRCEGYGAIEVKPKLTDEEEELLEEKEEEKRRAAARSAGSSIIDGLPEQRTPLMQLVHGGVFWAAASGIIVALGLAIEDKFSVAGFFVAIFNCMLAGIILGIAFGLAEPLLGLTRASGVFAFVKRLGFVLLVIVVSIELAIMSEQQQGEFLWTLAWDYWQRT